MRYLWCTWRIRDCRSAWCSEKWRGARAVWGARKKSGWGVSWTISELSASTPTSGRLQPRTGEWRRTACSALPEREEKNQEEGSPKQAASCWFARPCWLATSGANLYPPGVWFADAMAFFLWCHVCFVLLRFLYAFVEAAALRSVVLRYAGVTIATRVSLFGDVACSEYFFRFLFVSRVRGTFFPSGWCFFYLVTTGWIFDISLCENSINQSIQIPCRPTGLVGCCCCCIAIGTLHPSSRILFRVLSTVSRYSRSDASAKFLPTVCMYGVGWVLCSEG